MCFKEAAALIITLYDKIGAAVLFTFCLSCVIQDERMSFFIPILKSVYFAFFATLLNNSVSLKQSWANVWWFI